MKKIPTAEEFFKKWEKKSNVHIDELSEEDVADYAKKFAKLHVEAALEAASKKALLKQEWVGEFQQGAHSINYSIDEKSILNSYPKSNIK